MYVGKAKGIMGGEVETPCIYYTVQYSTVANAHVCGGESFAYAWKTWLLFHWMSWFLF